MLSQPLLVPSASMEEGGKPTTGGVRLSSVRNMVLLGLFSVVYSLGTTANWLAGFLVYTSAYKMSPVWLSVVNAFTLVIGIYTNVLVGYYGDAFFFSCSFALKEAEAGRGELGRRKPLVVVGFLLMAVSVLMISFPPTAITCCVEYDEDGGAGQKTLKGYYAISMVIGTLGSSIYSIPFYSWFVESAVDADDFLNVFTYPISCGTILGSLLGVVIVDAYYSTFYPSLLFCLLGGPLLVAVLVCIPNNTNHTSTSSSSSYSSLVAAAIAKQPPILSSLRLLMRTKEFQTVFVNRVVLNSALGIGSEFITLSAFVLFSYKIEHYQQLQQYAVLFFIVSYVGQTVFVALTNPLVKRVEKLVVYKALTLVAIVLAAMEFVTFVPGFVSSSINISQGTSNTMFVLFLVIGTAGNILYAMLGLLQGLIERDLMRYDLLSTGLNRENLYQAALTVPSQLLTFVVTAIPITIFYSSGLKAATTYTDDDLVSSKYTWTLTTYYEAAIFPTFFYAGIASLSYYLFRSYPLTQRVADSIQVAIECKQVKVETLPFSSPASSSMQVVDDQEVTLFLHFSLHEVRAMADSPCLAGGNEALASIYLHHIIGLVFFGPVVLIALLVGLVVQVQSNSSYAVFLINIFCLCSAYEFYECLRFSPIRTLCKLSGTEVKIKAVEAAMRNSFKCESLESVLTKNGIEISPSTTSSSIFPSTPLASSSSVQEEKTKMVQDDEQEFFSYAKIWLVLSGISVVGILFATETSVFSS